MVVSDGVGLSLSVSFAQHTCGAWKDFECAVNVLPAVLVLLRAFVGGVAFITLGNQGAGVFGINAGCPYDFVIRLIEELRIEFYLVVDSLVISWLPYWRSS